MQRKVLIGLLTVIFALIQTPAHAAAPKADAKCTKLNQTQNVSGTKFTCTKSGKKLLWKKIVKATQAPSATPTVTPTPTASATPAGFTMDQVKANNSSSKCWTVIDSKVYDLTNWINSHPGGPGAITSLCGTDGTSSFKGMHGGSGQPASRLAGYLLGPLAK